MPKPTSVGTQAHGGAEGLLGRLPRRRADTRKPWERRSGGCGLLTGATASLQGRRRQASAARAARCARPGPSALAHVAADPAALCCLQSVPSVRAPLLVPSVATGHLGGLPFWATNAAVTSVLWGPPAAGELLGDVASKGATGPHPRQGPACSPALGVCTCSLSALLVGV